MVDRANRAPHSLGVSQHGVHVCKGRQCFMQVELFCPDLTDSLTPTRELLDWSCICFEIQSWLRIVPTMMPVSRMIQAEPQDWTYGNTLLRSWMSLLWVTLHWHNIGDPEIQGHQKDASWLCDRFHPCLLIFEEVGRLRAVPSMAGITGAMNHLLSWLGSDLCVIPRKCFHLPSLCLTWAAPPLLRLGSGPAQLRLRCAQVCSGLLTLPLHTLTSFPPCSPLCNREAHLPPSCLPAFALM